MWGEACVLGGGQGASRHRGVRRRASAIFRFHAPSLSSALIVAADFSRGRKHVVCDGTGQTGTSVCGRHCERRPPVHLGCSVL